MTNEEAMKDLHSLKFMLNDEQYTDEIEEALDLAIEALSGRSIDRAELFNRLSEIKAPPEANDYKAEVYKLIQSM